MSGLAAGSTLQRSTSQPSFGSLAIQSSVLAHVKMTSNRSPLPGFVLTPQQQTLLVAALKSQQKTGDVNGQSNNGSPKQNDIQESPLIDYDYELSGPDSSFDFSLDTVIGDLPSGESGVKPYSPDNEHPDKRSHPIDEEEENGEAKRRESEDKVAKRPGRKPLTTEPSSVCYECPHNFPTTRLAG